MASGNQSIIRKTTDIRLQRLRQVGEIDPLAANFLRNDPHFDNDLFWLQNQSKEPLELSRLARNLAVLINDLQALKAINHNPISEELTDRLRERQAELIRHYRQMMFSIRCTINPSLISDSPYPNSQN